METGINQTPNSCYYQLRRFRCVPKCLFTEATVTLITSLILSRLDYCNSLLSRLPASSIHSLRYSQNCAVHPETKLKLTTSLLLQSLLWLPVPQRIQYRITALCYNCFMCTSPSYLCDCLQFYTLLYSVCTCVRVPVCYSLL